MTPEQREVIFEKARGRYAFDSLAEEAIREAIRLTEEAVREEYVDADSLADDKLTEVIEEAYAKGRKEGRTLAFSEGYDKGASEEWSVLEKRARADERAKCEAHSKDDVEAVRKEEREKYEAVLRDTSPAARSRNFGRDAKAQREDGPQRQRLASRDATYHPRGPEEKYLRREDGRIERICESGIGHTVYAPRGSDYVHGCHVLFSGKPCCYKFKRLTKKQAGLVA